LLGLEATGLSDIDSPVEGDGEEAGDGEAAVGKGGLILGLMLMLGPMLMLGLILGLMLMLGLMLGLMLMIGLPGGSDTGEGAWAMDNVTRARDMASMSVARVSAIVAQGRRRK
jgi:hypothetical protein